MKARKDLLQLAESIGAELEVWADSENSFTVQATAPDGKEWIETGGCSLVARWWTYAPEDKKIAMDDILERMKIGLQDEM